MSEINRNYPQKEIVHPLTGERIVMIQHPTGLPIYVWNKPGYKSSYAVFATCYGSIDNHFCYNGKDITVPEGIAHFLEHKLFENEDCDAFERYAATGANANAFTSFDKTAYLFSCTGDIRPSLEILLDFVQSPYFTAETVHKEQGIIGQEIRMCNDSPSRRVLFNLLKALYHDHPVRIDIAGTEESIAQITPELLYDCYHAFYNLHNMVLTVVGDVTVEQVLEVADKVLKPASPWEMVRPETNEPATVVSERVEEKMPVAAPLFYLGFKDLVSGSQTAQELAAADVLLQVIIGRASPLYARLMKEGLINTTFELEYFEGRDHAVWLFGGESRDPDAVKEAILEEIDRLRTNGIDPVLFDAARRAFYGRQVAQLNDVEGCGDLLVTDYFEGKAPFDMLDAAAALQLDTVQSMLAQRLQTTSCSLSVIRPEQ